MIATNDPDTRIRAHLALGPTELPEHSHAVVRARIERTVQRVAVRPLVAARPVGTLRVSFAAVALLIVAVVGVSLVPRGGFGGPEVSVPPSASLTPTTRPAAHAGLPPEGTEPSDTSVGEVAVHRNGSVGQAAEMWVYEDGRLVTWRFGDRSVDQGDGFIGLVLQRLTPEGVEFLRAAILETGMFQTPFVLAREGNAPFLEIRVRNGDRLIRGTWAWRGIAGNAPTASPEDEAALLALNALLTDPGSWPSASWADASRHAYVPSSYGICFGVRLRAGGPGEWAGPFDLARVLAVLPPSAQNILSSGAPTDDQSGMHAGAGCLRVTTDAARAVASALDQDSVARPRFDVAWLGYELEDPRLPEHEIWIQFGPVLPHGEAVWLGPG